jgi:hypothetical protein
MIQTLPTSLLDQLLGPLGRTMTPEFARELVELRAPGEVQARIDELAEKCNEGQLSDEERSEYEDYVRAIHMIGILQKKARKVLADGNPSR